MLIKIKIIVKKKGINDNIINSNITYIIKIIIFLIGS